MKEDWTIVLRVFAASRSRRGDKGRNDRKFLEALHYFVGVLRGEPQPLGDGIVGRAIRSLQREFFRPPSVTNEGHTNHNRKNLGPPIA